MLSKLSQKLRELALIADAYDTTLDDYQHPRLRYGPRIIYSANEVKQSAANYLPEISKRRYELEIEVGQMLRKVVEALKDDCTAISDTALISEYFKLGETTNERK